MGPKLRPFPWPTLPRVERAAWLEQRQVLERARAAVSPRAALAALGALTHTRVAARVSGCRVGPREAPPGGAAGPLGAMGEAALAVTFPATGVRVLVRPEPDLVRRALAGVLEQEFELGWQEVAPDASLRGASAALLLEVARRAARAEAPELFNGVASEGARSAASEGAQSAAPEGARSAAPDGARSAAPEGAQSLVYELTLRLDERAYRLELELERTPGGRGVVTPPRAPLAALGALPLRVPWVAAVFELPASALAEAAVGDVWLPDTGWLSPAPHTRAGVLAAPRHDYGLPVESTSGGFALGARTVSLWQEPNPMNKDPDVSRAPSALEQIVGETPLVVRLELGALELTARQWAELSPGDVIQSGRRIDEPVVLRAHGRELARGELVEIDGELGVRILALAPLEPPGEGEGEAGKR